MYRDANEQASVRYAAFDPAALVPEAQVQVSDAAIREYYEAHEENFVRPAAATVRYLMLPATPNAADSAAALQLARTVQQRLAAGETAAAVAADIAADTAAATARTSMTVTRNAQQFPPAFEQAAFNTAVGQLSEPVQTQYGYHVLKVVSRDGDTAEVEQVLVRVALSDEDEAALLARLDSLEALAEEMSLAEIGRRSGLAVQTAELAPPLAFVPGVGPAEEGVYWALEDAERGEVSPVFEAAELYYMFELVSRTEEGVLSVTEATPSIRPILVQRQQIEQARALLKEAETAARGGQPLEQIATEHNTSVVEAGPFSRSDFVPGLGRFTAPIGAAFGLQPGKVSELVEATGQLFLVQLVSRTEADRNAWQQELQQQRGRVLQALADEKWQQYLAALRENAEIVDNRRKLEQQAASAANANAAVPLY